MAHALLTCEMRNQIQIAIIEYLKCIIIIIDTVNAQKLVSPSSNR